MIKKCKVLINNEAVTVFRYDGVEVQIPSIKRKANYINVIKKDGNYIVVEDGYVEQTKITTGKQKKKTNKKTTIKENAEEKPEEVGGKDA